MADAKDTKKASLDLTSISAARASAIAAQRDKVLVAATRNTDFMPGIVSLWRSVRASGGDDLLAMLALLFRIAAPAKHIRSQFQDLAAQIDAPPSSSPQVLVDSDDRRYAAEGLEFAQGAWKIKYAAVAAIEEVAGEEAREQFLTVVVRASETLTAGLSALREAFDQTEIDTQDVETSRARRLTRVVSALKNAIIKVDPDLGPNFGSEVLALTHAAIGTAANADAGARVQLADALIDLIHTVVRFHFSVATDEETYAVVVAVRRWFVSDNAPPELTSRFSAVARQIQEALVLLAKQGIANDRLRRTLLTLLGERMGLAELRGLATGVPGIPGDLRQWLVAGKRDKDKMANSEAIEETVLRTLDRDVASLLRDTTEIRSALDRLEDDLPAAVMGYEPKLVPTTERLLTTLRRVTQRIEILAKRRQMRFGEDVGDIVKFNPVDHETPLDSLKGQTAKIKSPSVVRGADGALPIIVLKAEVEGT